MKLRATKSKAIEDEVQELCDEAFAKGYNQGVMDTAESEQAADEIQGEVECQVMFDLQSDVELSEEECTKIRYKSAMMAAVKFGLEQGLSWEDMVEDFDEVYNDMEGE